ncbi:unnamed protein product [Trifolium pratense]|uniref:Uncharacterized protein n=1 Tax=Trifolium pratense TaxID=57577 RepID=A0ACB0KXS3_TRIPR|nr:unnamed protein product [Trifolium pratense]
MEDGCEQWAPKKSTEKAPEKKGKKVELEKEEPLDSLAEKHLQQRLVEEADVKDISSSVIAIANEKIKAEKEANAGKKNTAHQWTPNFKLKVISKNGKRLRVVLIGQGEGEGEGEDEDEEEDEDEDEDEDEAEDEDEKEDEDEDEEKEEEKEEEDNFPYCFCFPINADYSVTGFTA